MIAALPMTAYLLLTAIAEVSSEPAGDILDILEEEVMVTAGSRVDVKLSEAPNNVWVIDRAMIDNTAALSIADVLRRVPGLIPLELQVGNSEIVVRGFGGEVNNRLLYMIDGRSIYGDHFGYTDPFALPVDLNDIERIEVVMGPAATLYGANAYSAVVNIITRSAPADGFRVRGVARGGMGFGSRDDSPGSTDVLRGPMPLGTAYVEYAQGFSNKLRLRASVGFQDVEASPQAVDASTPKEAYAKAYRHVNGILDLTYEDKGWSVRVQGMTSWRQGLLIGTIVTPAADHSALDGSLNIQVRKKGLIADGDELFIQAWARQLDFKWWVLPGSGLSSVAVNTNTWGGELLAQYATPTFYSNRLLIGTQLRVLDVVGPGIIQAGELQGVVSGYVDDQFRPFEQLIFTAGVRVEGRLAKPFAVGTRINVSPRASIVYLPAPGHSVRAEFSTASREPSSLEIFQDLYLSNGLPLILNNPALRAEQHLMGSLSYQGRFGWFKPRVDLFLGNKRSIISLHQLDTTTLFPLQYDNVADTIYYGVAGMLEANPIAGLTLWANYNYYQAQRVRNRTDDPVEVLFNPGPLGEAPRHVVGLGGSYNYKGLTVAVQAYFQAGYQDLLGSKSLAARIIINPLIKYAFDEKKRYSLALVGTNVGDIRFAGTLKRDITSDSAERIGPRVWLGADINWDR